MSIPYERFLATTDVDAWTESLEQLSLAADVAGEDQLPDLVAEAMCVAVYLGWLARVSGETATSARAAEQFDALFARVAHTSSNTSTGWQRCWALALANAGYTAHAAELLHAERPWSPELAVLLVTGDDIARLKELRRVVRGTPPTEFLPAVFYYAKALVNVGAAQEAQRVLEAAAWHDDDPMQLDLRGSIHEGLGQWAAAHDAYGKSSWPDHRYRAAVVGTISGRSAKMAELVLDDATRQVLLPNDGELDQAGVRRSVAFLNACRSQSLDSWILELELGKLGFRRRQFAEADAHMSRALAMAPVEARYAVAYLRFIDLTWLTGHGPEAPVDMSPEALTAADQVVGFDSDDATTPTVQIWLARETGDQSRLPASLTSWTTYDRAEALEVLGHEAHAIDGLIDHLGASFHHRAAGKLIERLNAAGLTAGARELAEIVLSESNADFFALWETCGVLQGQQPTGSNDLEGDGDVFDDWLRPMVERYRERLQELSQFEFMNTVRGFQLAQSAGDDDHAEVLLLRAAEQAEGVSELIAVAILRRTAPFRSRHADQEALRCLQRARTIARDRLGRLEIARELFRYRDVRAGRLILQEEGIFSPLTAMAHNEFIVALQCSPWCTDEERIGLAQRACERVANDAEAGVLGPYPHAYARRLLDTVSNLDMSIQYDPPMADLVRNGLGPRLVEGLPTSPWEGELVSEWPVVREHIDSLLAADDGPSEIESRLDELTKTDSIGIRLLIITELRDALARVTRELQDVTPQLPRSQIPISRWNDNTEGRMIELCDLWRSRIMGTTGAGAELRRFLATEQRLAKQWDERRHADSAPLLRQVVRTAAAQQHALRALLGPTQQAAEHPVLKMLFTQLKRDVERLSAEAAEQATAAEGRLASTTARAATEVS